MAFYHRKERRDGINKRHASTLKTQQSTLKLQQSTPETHESARNDLLDQSGPAARNTTLWRQAKERSPSSFQRAATAKNEPNLTWLRSFPVGTL